ncbi:MAG: hypothetical protein LBR40_02305 [Bacilli bacterium]|nr:hypothetical protein [Bacilli bacterium]
MKKETKIKIFRIFIALAFCSVLVYFTYPKPYKSFTKLNHFPTIINFDKMFATNAYLEDNHTAYKIGVEIQKDGMTSIYSGTYQARILAADNYRTVVPVKVSIYTGKDINETSKINQLHKVGTMGGQYHQNDTLTFEVKKGEYVYVLPEEQKKINQIVGYIYLERK